MGTFSFLMDKYLFLTACSDPGGPEGDRAQGQVSTICREGRAQLAEGREMLKGTIERTTRNESVADLLGLCMVMSSKLM